MDNEWTIFDIINARHKVVVEYCKQKGWDKDDLTMEQILEIRQQEEWKNPQKFSPTPSH